MNWKGSLRRIWIVLAVVGWLAALGLASFQYVKTTDFYWVLSEDDEKPAASAETVLGPRKYVGYAEVSPDGTRKALRYKLEFDPAFYQDYYGDYYPNQSVIAVVDLDAKAERHLFTGDDWTGDPHWLGNDVIFFESRCGTACGGLYLITIGPPLEIRPAVFSYMVSRKGLWETTFKDWFDRVFTFSGVVDEVKSEIVGEKPYLVFIQHDGDGKLLPEKRFLFTGRELMEIR